MGWLAGCGGGAGIDLGVDIGWVGGVEASVRDLVEVFEHATFFVNDGGLIVAHGGSWDGTILLLIYSFVLCARCAKVGSGRGGWRSNAPLSLELFGRQLDVVLVR